MSGRTSEYVYDGDISGTNYTVETKQDCEEGGPVRDR